MRINYDEKTDTLTVTFDKVSSLKPYVSKSAALKGKTDAQALATTGGFQRVDKYKISVNLNLA